MTTPMSIGVHAHAYDNTSISVEAQGSDKYAVIKFTDGGNTGLTVFPSRLALLALRDQINAYLGASVIA